MRVAVSSALALPSALAATGPSVPARVEATWTTLAEIPMMNNATSSPINDPWPTLERSPPVRAR